MIMPSRYPARTTRRIRRRRLQWILIARSTLRTTKTSTTESQMMGGVGFQQTRKMPPKMWSIQQRRIPSLGRGTKNRKLHPAMKILVFPILLMAWKLILYRQHTKTQARTLLWIRNKDRNRPLTTRTTMFLKIVYH